MKLESTAQNHGMMRKHPYLLQHREESFFDDHVAAFAFAAAAVLLDPLKEQQRSSHAN